MDRAEKRTRAGFSLLELMVVVAIVTIVAGLAVPSMIRAVRESRLRGAGTDFAGLLQQARMNAVQDDRYYSVYQITTGNLQQEFVDIYPQAVNGASGSGGALLDPRDPVITISPEVGQQPWTAAPGTGNLLNQFLGNNAAGATLFNGGAILLGGPAPNTAPPPVTFGPEGTPCFPRTVTGGTVCNSSGGLTAYWVFFQDNVTQDWEAVTVTPAGRIQRWYYTGAAWGKM